MQITEDLQSTSDGEEEAVTPDYTYESVIPRVVIRMTATVNRSMIQIQYPTNGTQIL